MFVAMLQMLLCLEDDYESPDEESDKKKRDKDRRFQWNHGCKFSADVYFVHTSNLVLLFSCCMIRIFCHCSRVIKWLSI